MAVAKWNTSGLKWNQPGLKWNQPAPAPTNTTMPNDNRISAAITPQNKAAYLQHMTEARALIPFSVNLTPEERKSMRSIAVDRAGMLDAFVQEMTAHPELIPTYLNMVEVNKDASLLRDVWQLRAAADHNCEVLEDGATCLGADLMIAFSTFYAVVKDAKRRNVPGIDSTYDRLAPFFARRSSGGGTPTPPSP